MLAPQRGHPIGRHCHTAAVAVIPCVLNMHYYAICNTAVTHSRGCRDWQLTGLYSVPMTPYTGCASFSKALHTGHSSSSSIEQFQHAASRTLLPCVMPLSHASSQHQSALCIGYRLPQMQMLPLSPTLMQSSTHMQLSIFSGVSVLCWHCSGSPHAVSAAADKHAS
jgi:hypothetical protein